MDGVSPYIWFVPGFKSLICFSLYSSEEVKLIKSSALYYDRLGTLKEALEHLTQKSGPPHQAPPSAIYQRDFSSPCTSAAFRLNSGNCSSDHQEKRPWTNPRIEKSWPLLIPISHTERFLLHSVMTFLYIREITNINQKLSFDMAPGM